MGFLISHAGLHRLLGKYRCLLDGGWKLIGFPRRKLPILASTDAESERRYHLLSAGGVGIDHTKSRGLYLSPSKQLDEYGQCVSSRLLNPTQPHRAAYQPGRLQVRKPFRLPADRRRACHIWQGLCQVFDKISMSGWPIAGIPDPTSLLQPRRELDYFSTRVACHPPPRSCMSRPAICCSDNAQGAVNR